MSGENAGDGKGPSLPPDAAAAWDVIIANKQFWWQLGVPAVTYIVLLRNGSWMKMSTIRSEVDEILPNPVVETNYSGVAQALSKYDEIWFERPQEASGSAGPTGAPGEHRAKVVPELIKSLAARLQKIAAGEPASRRYIANLPEASQAVATTKRRPLRSAVRLLKTTRSELIQRKAVLIKEKGRDFTLDEVVYELTTCYFEALDQTSLTPEPVWTEPTFVRDPDHSRTSPSKPCGNLTIRPSTYSRVNKARALLIAQRQRNVTYDETIRELVRCFDHRHRGSIESGPKEGA